MKKNLILKLFFFSLILLTIAAVLGSSVSWQHRPADSLADGPQEMPHISTEINGITGKGKPFTVLHSGGKAIEKYSESSHPRPRTPRIVSDDFQNSSFYQTIIDNNLFRPLGWRHPRPKPTYRLSGTVIPTDGNKPRYAIVQTTTRNKTHIVTIGEKLDTNTTVTDIQPRVVILDKAGQQITLKLEIYPWLNTKRSRARRR